MGDKPERIPSGEMSAYERWELPSLEGSGAFNSTRSAAAPKRIKPLTADDIEKIRQQAYQAGLEEGKKDGLELGRKEGIIAGKAEGREQGIVDGKAQVDQTVEQLKCLMTKLLDPIAEQQQIVEQGTLNIALALARTVIYRELSSDSTSLKNAVTEIFHSLPSLDHKVCIKLNPTDLPYVQNALEALNTQADIISDPVISAGGCIIETSNQLIDFTVEKRFQKAVHAMLAKASQGDSHLNQLDSSASISELSDYPTKVLDEAEEEIARENEVVDKTNVEDLDEPPLQTNEEDHNESLSVDKGSSEKGSPENETSKPK